jgi:hypothetical protein
VTPGTEGRQHKHLRARGDLGNDPGNERSVTGGEIKQSIAVVVQDVQFGAGTDVSRHPTALQADLGQPGVEHRDEHALTSALVQGRGDRLAGARRSARAAVVARRTEQSVVRTDIAGAEPRVLAQLQHNLVHIDVQRQKDPHQTQSLQRLSLTRTEGSQGISEGGERPLGDQHLTRTMEVVAACFVVVAEPAIGNQSLSTLQHQPLIALLGLALASHTHLFAECRPDSGISVF